MVAAIKTLTTTSRLYEAQGSISSTVLHVFDVFRTSDTSDLPPASAAINAVQQRAAKLNKKCNLQAAEIVDLRAIIKTLESTISSLRDELSAAQKPAQQSHCKPSLSIDTEKDDMLESLEEAYEELHSKFEKVWAEKNAAVEMIQTLKEQNAFLLAGGSTSNLRS